MLSPFLKRLLFARQFFMIDGKIEILGKKQVMLPSDVMFALDALNNKEAYTNVKNVVKKDVEYYAKKLGSSEEGILKNIDDIFGMFGLGKLELVDINFKKKTCILRLHDPPLKQIDGRSAEFQIIPAVLSGIFSFLFDKDIDLKQTNHAGKGSYYGEYVVR